MKLKERSGREKMIEGVTGVVLAGGDSRRFGRNKALADWGEGRLVNSVIDLLRSIFPENYLMVKEPDAFRFLQDEGVRVLKDMTEETHPLGGIYSGLSHIKTRYAFVCGCDMPHIQEGLIRALWMVSEGHDAVIPVWEGRPQTLCGIYSKSCSSTIKEMIEQDRLKIYELYSDIRTRFFEENEVRRVDPAGLSFVDIDTITEYEEARNIDNAEVGSNVD